MFLLNDYTENYNEEYVLHLYGQKAILQSSETWKYPFRVFFYRHLMTIYCNHNILPVHSPALNSPIIQTVLT